MANGAGFADGFACHALNGGVAMQTLLSDNLAGSCSPVLRHARERMERAAGLANLTIRVVDPVGLETDRARAASVFPPVVARPRE